MTKVLQLTDAKTPALESTQEIQVDTLSLDSFVDRSGVTRRRGRMSRIEVLSEFRRRSGHGYQVLLLPSFGASFTGGTIARFSKFLYENILLRWLLAGIRKAGAQVGVIDYSDDFTIHPSNKSLLEDCEIYFKRELSIDKWRSLESLSTFVRPCAVVARSCSHQKKLVAKLRPISLGLGLNESTAVKLRATFGRLPKKYDLFYCGGTECRPLRAAAESELDELSKELNVYAPKHQLSYEEFTRALAESKMCLSPSGLGWDCYRHYEALFFGAIPVVTRPDILMQTPLVDGENSLHYSPELTISERVLKAHSDTHTIESLAAQIARLADSNRFMGAGRTAYIVSLLAEGGRTGV